MRWNYHDQKQQTHLGLANVRTLNRKTRTKCTQRKRQYFCLSARDSQLDYFRVSTQIYLSIMHHYMFSTYLFMCLFFPSFSLFRTWFSVHVVRVLLFVLCLLKCTEINKSESKSQSHNEDALHIAVENRMKFRRMAWAHEMCICYENET